MRLPQVVEMSAKQWLSVVLAAGEGTRMVSSRPKVLHEIGRRSLVAHVLAVLHELGGRIAIVVAPDRATVSDEVRKLSPRAEIFIQAEQRGTAHAVLAARQAMKDGINTLIVFADTPLLSAATLGRMRAAVEDGAAVAVLGFHASDPTGYGRLVKADGSLVAIREEKDASATEKAITFCNAGVMALAGADALSILDRIDDRNAKREYYLTDAVAIARGMGLKTVALETQEDEVRGINTRAQLAETEAVLQQNLRKKWLEAGVTMQAPETVFLSADTELARDVVIEPHVVFGQGVVVEEGAVIHSFSHLAGAHVGKNASVGPFARLRPGTRLGANAKIGNFVEVKAAVFGDGAKANHLAYIGDATVGMGANVGAGTITCNYDGVAKHRTEIGKGAFIGSNSALVAPVKIGEGAYVGSGSVITEDVPAQALAIARGRQVVKKGWAASQKAKSGGKKKMRTAD